MSDDLGFPDVSRGGPCRRHGPDACEPHRGRRAGPDQGHHIDTPLSPVRSNDNSVMMLDVSEDGVTELSVLKGYVTFESRAGATRVGAGKTLTIRGEKDAELSPIDAPDEWERWNIDHDRKLTTWGESARYLPDELHEYSADEVYYGYGYYGPGSVNITTININTVVVNRTYVNAGHGHAVTVVKRGTFGTGRREFVRNEGNPFLDAQREHRRDIAIAPPQVRPTRPIVLVPPEARDQARQRQRLPEQEHVRQEFPETRHELPPKMRTDQPTAAPAVPHAVRTEQQLPPERVQRNRPDVLKNERRLVKEREGSVFRQQAPDNLPVKRSNEPRVIIRNPVKLHGEQKPPKPKKENGEKREGR